MRKTHAKDMQGPHEPTPSQKIEETDSSIEDDFKWSNRQISFESKHRINWEFN